MCVNLQGASDFVGQQIHAKHFRDVSVASGRRVLIVGAGKTGTDCACNLLASRAAASVTMLYRQVCLALPLPAGPWGLGEPKPSV